MRDKLWEMGNLSLATAGTTVFSADTVDTGALSTRFTKDNKVHEDEDGAFVFIPATDFAAIDGIIPIIQESVDNSTFTPCVTGAVVTAPKAGQPIIVPMPKRHARYLRAAATPQSSGSFTARTVSAGYELGPMDA